MSRPQGGNRTGAALLAVVLTLTVASWAAGVSASAHGSPSPTESPTPTATLSPTESPSASETVAPTPTSDPTTSPTPVSFPPSTSLEPPVTPPPGPHLAIPDRWTHAHDHLLSHAEGRRHHRHRQDWRDWAPDPRWGDYGTAKLDRAAAGLRRRGWTEERIATEVYTPFIVEGPATWSDSWGAPRWVGGYHPHHGQDVLCRFGAPVLAVDRGEIVFDNDPLGGRVAYLTLPNGAFWYYAHLKGYAKDLASHDRVRPGRVIGYCGATGDASVPHVHFAFFDTRHTAVDPMPALVAWLDAAEQRLGHDDRRRTPLPDPVSLLRPLHPLLDHGSVEPGLISVPASGDGEEPIPPKARALGVAAVLIVAGATVGATERRRRTRSEAEIAAADGAG
jgi:murein DD-endopeptidase MepM/ murein hydrolase activator NlpD